MYAVDVYHMYSEAVSTTSADIQNWSQQASSHGLKEPMHKLLDRVVSELPDQMVALNEAMSRQLPNGLGLTLLRSERVGDGAWDLRLSATDATGEVVRRTVRVQWAGDTAPGNYDFYAVDHAPFRGPALVYHGTLRYDALLIEIATYMNDQVLPRTPLGRFDGENVLKN